MVRLESWQVALLRGVNVGGGKKVPMASLRAIVSACGYRDVRTHLNSGNVIFRTAMSPADVAAALRTGIREALDVDTPVLVRSRDALARLLAENPLADEAAAQPSRVLVMLWDTSLSDPALAQVRAAIRAMPTTVEQCRVGQHAAYFHFPDGISASRPFELLGRQLKHTVTSRNWNTMTALLAMMTEDAPEQGARA